MSLIHGRQRREGSAAARAVIALNFACMAGLAAVLIWLPWKASTADFPVPPAQVEFPEVEPPTTTPPTTPTPMPTPSIEELLGADPPRTDPLGSGSPGETPPPTLEPGDPPPPPPPKEEPKKKPMKKKYYR